MRKFEPTEVQAKWIDALSSNTYKQGKNVLCREDEYCCLGVLCEIIGAIKSNIDPLTYGTVTFAYKNETSETVLPTTIADEVHMKSINGTFIDSKNQFISLQIDNHLDITISFSNLTEMNDSGLTFKEIVTFIEKNPWLIFSKDKHGRSDDVVTSM